MARSENAATIQGPGPNPGDGYPVDVNPAPGGFVVTPNTASGAPGDSRSATFTGWADALGLLITQISNMWVFNGVTWDRLRGNVESTILTSGTRTNTTGSGTVTNHNGRGVTLFFDVTASGANTITFQVQFRNPITGAFFTAFNSIVINTTGLYMFQVYPGASGGTGSAALALSRQWRILVTHSSSGPSWTYSVGATIQV